jgi:hypothetical protein
MKTSHIGLLGFATTFLAFLFLVLGFLINSPGLLFLSLPFGCLSILLFPVFLFAIVFIDS